MKKNKVSKEKKSVQCMLCQANFDVWLDNEKMNPEKEEKTRQHLLSYCPVCSRADSNN